jgi:hypothetical protein
MLCNEALREQRRDAQAYGRELAARIGREDSSVRRIWGFGSTFDEALPYRKDSDIDLAGEGGDIRAWKIASRASCKVDWVELDDQADSMVAEVTSRGMVLYER